MRTPTCSEAFPNSYGTLGYAVRLRIELEPVLPFVSLTHLRFHALPDLVAKMEDIVTTGRHDGVAVDYLDGVVFSADESYLCLGTKTAEPGPVSDYTGSQIYYRSIRHDAAPRRIGSRSTTICGGGIRTGSGAQPRSGRSIRSSVASGLVGAAQRVYAKLMRLERRFDIGNRLERLRGRPRRERVIQDVEIPIERSAEFLDWFLSHVPIEPIWLCPLRLRDDAAGRCTR